MVLRYFSLVYIRFYPSFSCILSCLLKGLQNTGLWSPGNNTVCTQYFQSYQLCISRTTVKFEAIIRLLYQVAANCNMTSMKTALRTPKNHQSQSVPQHRAEKIYVINIMNFCIYYMTFDGSIMPLRSIQEIISKTPWRTLKELLFFGHLERKLKEQQAQANLFPNKKSTPWIKVSEFTTCFLALKT